MTENTQIPEEIDKADQKQKEMTNAKAEACVKSRNLFSKERALYLVDNPTKVGFSWWFFFAGIAAGYWMHKNYGDSEFIILFVEKYIVITFNLIFWLPRRWVDKRVRSGVIARDSALLYLVLPAGYVFTFLAVMWFSHMFCAIFFA